MKITFLGLPDHPKARVALLPIPLETTTTWLKGTKFAPLEILKVSSQLEFFDEETEETPQETLGFFTFPCEELPLEFDEALKRIEALTRETLEREFFPIFIGGEHTLTYPVIKVLKERYSDLKILHLDAHLDFREEYLGSKINHATVMKRIYELGVPFMSVGIRALSKEEYEEVKAKHLKVIFAYRFKEFNKVLEEIEDFLKEGRIYLTLDMDALDPSLAPGVGTPEPGGLNWFELCEILKRVAKANVVGMDLVETRPLPDYPFTEFLSAKIIYKFTAYLSKFNPEFRPS